MTAALPNIAGAIQRLPRSVVVALIVIWVIATSAIAGTLMASHWLTMPKPHRASIASALEHDHQRLATGEWMMVHFFYADCPCSLRIVDHLIESERPPKLVEHIVMVGRDEAMLSKLRSRGYSIEIISPQELKTRYHTRAAPMLAVLGPDATLHYLGGYTERKQGLGIVDLAILQRVQSDHDVRERPLYGCAVDRSLQRTVDPLGIKY